MNPELRGELERLQKVVNDLEEASRRALGFVKTIQYMGITFHASEQIVVADLSPLAFLQLVEPIELVEGGLEEAVRHLYDRVSPLLQCTHKWTNLKRAADEQVRKLEGQSGDPAARAYTCKLCSAYAFGGTLPAIGRAMP